MKLMDAIEIVQADMVGLSISPDFCLIDEMVRVKALTW
jgi:hypothetical protein